MKTTIFAAALLVVSTVHAAEDKSVPVTAQVLSARSYDTAEGSMTALEIKLLMCGEAACRGTAKLVLANPSAPLEINSVLGMSLDESILQEMSSFEGIAVLELLGTTVHPATLIASAP
jgi:hypothetical protein